MVLLVQQVIDMLTALQYEAVGRFTLTFNEIELVMKTYGELLGGKDSRMMFRQRVDWFEKALATLGDEPDIISAQVQAVRKQLDRARDLAKQRNEYVHSLVEHNFATNETRLKIRGSEVSCDESELRNLAAHAADAADHLSRECERLLETVKALRL